jgi:hypothetical protein
MTRCDPDCSSLMSSRLSPPRSHVALLLISTCVASARRKRIEAIAGMMIVTATVAIGTDLEVSGPIAAVGGAADAAAARKSIRTRQTAGRQSPSGNETTGSPPWPRTSFRPIVVVCLLLVANVIERGIAIGTEIGRGTVSATVTIETATVTETVSGIETATETMIVGHALVVTTTVTTTGRGGREKKSASGPTAVALTEVRTTSSTMAMKDHQVLDDAAPRMRTRVAATRETRRLVPRTLDMQTRN